MTSSNAAAAVAAAVAYGSCGSCDVQPIDRKGSQCSGGEVDFKRSLVDAEYHQMQDMMAPGAEMSNNSRPPVSLSMTD